MARKLRLQYPGALYHLVSRGVGRRPIFLDARDRASFLEILGRACAKTGWQVHAYCLLPDHFHLVLETPQPNLVAGMKWFLGAYALRYNRRHNLSRRVFSGRYKSLFVDDRAEGYLRTVCDYVHLNPARAKLLQPSRPLQDFRWSSYGEYLKGPSQRPAWLRTDLLLWELKIAQDNQSGRRQFAQRMEALRQADEDAAYRKIRRGWCFGDKEFRKELLAQLRQKTGAWHNQSQIQETAEKKARRLLREELRKIGWNKKDLERQRKGAAKKVRIALRLRQETTMTVGWIARHLRMGVGGSVARLLQLAKKNEKRSKSSG